MDRLELERQVAAAGWWWHTIDLGQGVVTPGAGQSREILARAQLPLDLTGKTVLDVGACDGFFSFAAERRGAARVVALDAPEWGAAGWGRSDKHRFELARRALGSRVEDREMDVYDIRPETVGVFDLVLFLGVLYHLRHPLLALERLRAVTGERLVVETLVDLLRVRRPALAFYPGAEASADPTNWWGPNPNAVLALLRSAGFPNVRLIGVWRQRRSTLARALRRPPRTLADWRSLLHRYRRGRAIFHAWV
jgi:tRNA (mo5U34)-methyltransferase